MLKLGLHACGGDDGAGGGCAAAVYNHIYIFLYTRDASAIASWVEFIFKAGRQSDAYGRFLHHICIRTF